MMHFYKDPENNLHSLDSVDDEWRLPAGSVQITESEHQGIIESLIPIDNVKSNIWVAIKTYRDDRFETGGVKVAADGVDYWFYTTLKAQAQYANLYAQFNIDPTYEVADWKTMSGDFITMTKTVNESIQSALVAADVAVFAVGQSHYAAIMALETISEVKAYDYKTGWPTIYGE